MIREVGSVVDFVSNLLGKSGVVGPDRTKQFAESLATVLCTHYLNHWFPDKPNKGSAYRCIRIANREMDPLIVKAGRLVGLSISDLLALLPSELTLWVDPMEVSYRIGEEGSIGVLYDGENGSDSENSHQTIYQSCNEQMRLSLLGTGTEQIGSWDLLTTFVAS